MRVTYWAEHAWISSTAERGVVIEVADDRFRSVVPGVPAPPEGATRLAGLTLPGLANVHSHAFHRGLRGRTHAGKGTFWTWRERMYSLAERLDPASYFDLARATYAEMALAGVTCVGEFHYLHHGPGGSRYDDPNAMGGALIAAAAAAGLRITLLDALYLTSSVDGSPLRGPQLRFGDADVNDWWDRVATLPPAPHAVVGVAAHSLRAVPADQLTALAALAGDRPVHVHVSEQRAENAACRAHYGRTPTEVLDSCGLVGPLTTAVHATHLSDEDRTILGDGRTNVCFCPTTERDLADGIGRARALVDSGARLCLGSDSHAVIDLFEEARAVELNERLRDEHRGHFDAGELLAAATTTGHAALGWPDAGTIEAGARADLVTVRLDTVRTAGYDDPVAAVMFAAIAGDVTDVVVDGRPTVHNGQHLLVPDVPRALAGAVAAVWR